VKRVSANGDAKTFTNDKVLVDTNVPAYAYDRHHLSYGDAQIWATAKLNQISVVFSEDFSDGRTTEGIRFTNPFSAKFQLSSV